ncbi:hypothetical protein KNE206_51040 [Kitasatospora sp. NE20-6]|uniref:hypothetical protein n=1 Tax=Kitasatospora sp. NE20-6 TaxID=2859066 RepID=UPI0034DB9201
MKLFKRAVHAVVGLALAVTGVVSLGGTAHAGSSGQQLMVVDNKDTAASVKVIGLDQNGNSVQGCFNTPNFKNGIGGWWWHGTVTVVAYNGQNCTGGDNWSGYTSVPSYRAGGDWWAIVTNDNAPSTSQQIEFFDNQGIAYSMYVEGTNQNGQGSSHCVATPSWDSFDSNWWWRGEVHITTYPTGNCSGSSNGYHVRYVNGNGSSSWFGVTN